MIRRLVVTAGVMLALLWGCSQLTGCAGTTISAKVTGEPDFKQPVGVIPKVEAGVGYTF